MKTIARYFFIVVFAMCFGVFITEAVDSWVLRILAILVFTPFNIIVSSVLSRVFDDGVE